MNNMNDIEYGENSGESLFEKRIKELDGTLDRAKNLAIIIMSNDGEFTIDENDPKIEEFANDIINFN